MTKSNLGRLQVSLQVTAHDLGIRRQGPRSIDALWLATRLTFSNFCYTARTICLRMIVPTLGRALLH